jgi:hypothetical protein
VVVAQARKVGLVRLELLTLALVAVDQAQLTVAQAAQVL